MLAEPVANLIAAGEVVERPAAVVKELIENALDAGARTVEIHCRQAGFKELRVVDDGWGIPPEEASLALERHATSKIAAAEDLQHIQTFGFRGEALASIAAVSRLELLTRAKPHETGFLVVSEGAKKIQSRQAGCAPGTSVTVKELFFNTPARRRFMKSAATEQSHLITAVELAAFANLQVGFKLVCDERETLFCPAGQTLEERLRLIYPKTAPKKMLEVYFEAGGVEIRGAMGTAADHQSTRNHMRWFVNQRPVDHRGISHAAMQVFQSLLPRNRYPFVYLFFRLPADLVDVNVHPTKREVRFRDESAIHHITVNAIKKPLESANPSSWVPASIQDGLPAGQMSVYPSHQMPGTTGWSGSRVQEAVMDYHIQKTGHQENQPPLYKLMGIERIAILGLVGKSYIAGQDDSGFFLIDFHAAHERLIYEELKDKSKKVSKQMLLIPVEFDLEPAKYDLLFEIKELLEENGIEISPFGKSSVLVNSQPDFFQGDIKSVLLEIIDSIIEKPISINDIKEKTIATIACKAAIKTGDKIKESMMISLIKKVNELEIIPTCPHGRPFIFRLTWGELDRIFKRDYS